MDLYNRQQTKRKRRSASGVAILIQRLKLLAFSSPFRKIPKKELGRH
jgi:hypothetical protein